MAALILAGLALAGDKLQDMRDRKREKGRARRSTLVILPCLPSSLLTAV
jgi:hypothetical protein